MGYGKTLITAGMVGALAVSVGTRPAQATGLDVVPGSRYTSVRAASLGGAYLPLADDGASGLFYNPAGIGKIRGTRLELANLQFQLNSQFIGNFDMDFYKVTSLSAYKSSLVNHPNSMPGVGAAFAPTFSFRGFSVGLLAESRFAGKTDTAEIRYRSRYLLVPAAGYALRLASGVVRIGYSVQWVNKAEGDNIVPMTQSPLGWNQYLDKGSGLSHNAGFSLTLPFEYLPSAHVVARNIGTLRYSSSAVMPLAANPYGKPRDEPMQVDAAMGFTSKAGGGASFNLVGEWRDMTNTSGVSLMGHLSVGAEMNFRENFFLRLGIGSGYPSLGLGFRTRKADLNLGWYSEETGQTFRSERDARFALQYQIRAF